MPSKLLQEKRDYILSQKKLLSHILNYAADGVVLSDPSLPDYPILYTSESFLLMSGYQEEEIIGHNCRFLQGPATCRDTIKAIKQCIFTKQPFKGRILNYRKNGEPFYNYLRIHPLELDDGLSILVGAQLDLRNLNNINFMDEM